MNNEPSLEADLKVMFLTWASTTISMVAEAEVSRAPELARSLQSLAGRVRAIATAIAARESGSTASECEGK